MTITAAPTSPVVAGMPGQAIAKLDAPFLGRDEPLFLGSPVGPVEGFPSFNAAVEGASRLATTPLAVVRSSDAFRAHQLMQTVWKDGIFASRPVGAEPANFAPVPYGRDRFDPKFAFTSLSVDGYGRVDRDHKEGRLVVDPVVDGIVGNGWMVRDGELELIPVGPRPDPSPMPPAPPHPAPPAPPAPTPAPPAPAPGRALVQDITEAARLAAESARIIGEIPGADNGEASKEARKKAHATNLAAQKRIELQFNTPQQDVVSALRQADAHLEDATWQLITKPSPDGRFNGVDVPGALRDTTNAVTLLETLRADLVKGLGEEPAAA